MNARAKTQSAGGTEDLDLSHAQNHRATYYDPSQLPTVSAADAGVTVQRGARQTPVPEVLKGVVRDRDGRFSATAVASPGLLPSSQAVPLVVIVAGFGAAQSWPSLVLLDGARRLPVAGCDGSSGDVPQFDLILLVPRDDTTSVLPCFGSQGCDKAGIDFAKSGLTVGLASFKKGGMCPSANPN